MASEPGFAEPLYHSSASRSSAVSASESIAGAGTAAASWLAATASPSWSQNLVGIGNSTAAKALSQNRWKLIAPLIESVKELKAENDVLRNEIANLRSVVETLNR